MINPHFGGNLVRRQKELKLFSMFFSIKDLSKYLEIKPSTLYSWTSKGLIPHYKVHGLLRFKKEEINLWVETFRKDKSEVPLLNLPSRNHRDIDTLIARAKREVYNLPQGRPDRIKAGKDGD